MVQRLMIQPELEQIGKAMQKSVHIVSSEVGLKLFGFGFPFFAPITISDLLWSFNLRTCWIKMLEMLIQGLAIPKDLRLAHHRHLDR